MRSLRRDMGDAPVEKLRIADQTSRHAAPTLPAAAASSGGAPVASASRARRWRQRRSSKRGLVEVEALVEARAEREDDRAVGAAVGVGVELLELFEELEVLRRGSKRSACRRRRAPTRRRVSVSSCFDSRRGPRGHLTGNRRSWTVRTYVRYGASVAIAALPPTSPLTLPRRDAASRRAPRRGRSAAARRWCWRASASSRSRARSARLLPGGALQRGTVATVGGEPGSGDDVVGARSGRRGDGRGGVGRRRGPPGHASAVWPRRSPGWSSRASRSCAGCRTIVGPPWSPRCSTG